MSEPIEIGVNVPRNLKPYLHDDRWAAFSRGRQVGELTTYEDARRTAVDIDGDVCYCPEPEPVAPAPVVDWNQPQASILSRRGKSKAK